jgi:DNA invertase Pin-like site-specific DNA recombinase
MSKLVAYFRVSTEGQGRSGLGLEGQRAAVLAYARQARAEVLAEFTDVETGKRNDRPELLRALALAKRTKSVLVIAKLDRLSRNLAFLANLMESGVEFVCCDMPNANRLTLHVMAAFAEEEARRIGERTRAALAAYKARGGVLGAARPECRNLTADARARGARAAAGVRREARDETYAEVIGRARELVRGGLSLRAVAAALNAEGLTTATGRGWSHVQVGRLLSPAPQVA